MLVIAPFACKADPPSKPPDEPTKPAVPDKVSVDASVATAASQWYRGTFVPDGGPQLPIYFQVPAAGTAGKGKLVTAAYETEIDATWNAKELTIAFPLYNTQITATADAQGKLTGNWRVDSRSWGTGQVAFHATPVAEPAPEARFDTEQLPGEPIDLGAATTVWRTKFPESGTGKLVIEQPAVGVFTATIQFSTGNTVYLAGNGRGKELRFSALVGQSPYLLALQLDAAKQALTGTWLAGPKLAWRESLTARRTKDFALPPAVKTEERNQAFAMPQLAKHRGKPLIVELGASWCSACKHAAVALKRIHDRHHANGLEIVTLTYEFTDDSAYNKKQAEAFKAAYSVPWEVIPVDGDAERAAEIIPEGLVGVDASGFPITLFVKPDGSIHAVHNSFPSPELTELNARWVKDYEDHAAAIMAAKK